MDISQRVDGWCESMISIYGIYTFELAVEVE